MKYFVSNNLATLNDLNTRGVRPGDVTSRWVHIAKHPSRDEWAACIPEDYMPRLGDYMTTEEYIAVGSSLREYLDMEADGWNVPRD